VDAVNLDGGGSTCLYYRGAMVVAPGRRLSNLLTLYERSPLDELSSRHVQSVAPAQMRAGR